MATQQVGNAGIFLGLAQDALSLAYQSLDSFFNNPAQIELAFGSNYNQAVASQLFSAFAQGNFDALPEIKVLSNDVLGATNGAFAAQKNEIYLNERFLTANADNVQAIANVLIEEIGHFIDAQINTVDSAGDEGEIFAKLVKGESISQQELAFLKAEDDTKTITLNGESITIEQNNPLLVTNNNDSGAGSLRDAISYASIIAGVDNIDLTRVSGAINLSSSLIVNSDINFIDDGNTTISGQNARQIFSVTGANVTFSRLTLADGYAKGGDAIGGAGGGLGAGGALLINSGNVTLNNVTFAHNQAIGGNSSGNAGSGGKGGNYNRGGVGGGSGSSGGSGFLGSVGGASGSGGKGGKGAPGITQNGRGGEAGGNGGKGGFGSGGGGGGGGTSSKSRGSGGSGGSNGSGGDFGGSGTYGSKGEGGGSGTNGRDGGQGGQGGGGAGLGGAIFVNNGANLISLNSVFLDDDVAGGTGVNAGQYVGKNIFVRRVNR